MSEYDIGIIGAGPAGMTAGIYVARAGRKAVLLEAGIPGGQVFTSHAVENYPGFIEPVTGQQLSKDMRGQVERLGVEIMQFPVSKFDISDNGFTLKSYNKELKVRSLIISTGSIPKKLGVDGEEKLFGSGVSYCSTCDGMFFKNKKIFVIGGGNSALEATEHLALICKEVVLVHRRDQFRGDSILVERLKKFKNVTVLYCSVIKKIQGENKVESVLIKNVITKKESVHDTDGVFIYIGFQPQNDLFIDKLKCNDRGYIKVDCDMKTSVAGVFAAGDIVDKPIRQIITAAADGCIAGLGAVKYLAEQ